MTQQEVPTNGPQLKAFIQGACLRCDREALGAAMRSVALRAGVTEHRALAEWLIHETDWDDILVDDLERLPIETLEVLTFNVARLLYASTPPPSRAS